MWHMRKVVVFDAGWGGEVFAKVLRAEFGVVEVERVIDWRHAPYGRMSWEEIARRVQRAVRPYVGEVDLVVLASYEATVAAIDLLRDEYPEQKFVGFEPRIADLLPANTPQVTLRRLVMAGSEAVRRSVGYRVERARLSLEYEVVEVDTTHWSELVNRDALTAESLRADLVRQGITDLGYATAERLDAILLYSTDLAEQQELIEEVMGWQMIVVSDFERVMREIARELGLQWTRGSSRKWHGI